MNVLFVIFAWQLSIILMLNVLVQTVNIICGVVIMYYLYIPELCHAVVVAYLGLGWTIKFTQSEVRMCYVTLVAMVFTC